jgi:hypothetical protein
MRGFVRAGGELDILGIISMSVELTLALAYERRGNEAVLVGEAAFTAEIHMLFFSASVELHMRREYTGNSSPTTAYLEPQGERILVAGLENENMGQTMMFGHPVEHYAF